MPDINRSALMIAPLACVFFYGACESYTKYQSAAGPEPLALYCYQGSDEFFGGEDSIAHVIKIKNTTSDKLRDCRITINDKFTAHVKDLEIDRGFDGPESARPTGDPAIGVDETLEFILSHDVNNHEVFEDSEGNAFPRTERIWKVTLDTAGGAYVWLLGE